MAFKSPLTTTHSFPVRPSSVTYRLSWGAPVFTLRVPPSFVHLPRARRTPARHSRPRPAAQGERIFLSRRAVSPWQIAPAAWFHSHWGGLRAPEGSRECPVRLVRQNPGSPHEGNLVRWQGRRKAGICESLFTAQGFAGPCKQREEVGFTDGEINIKGIHLHQLGQDGAFSRAHSLPWAARCRSIRPVKGAVMEV